MKKKILIISFSLIMIAALLFVGFKYIWNNEDEVLPVSEPREFLYGNEVLFRDVFVGSNCNFGLSSDGKLYAWGANSTCGLGLGDNYDRNLPEPLRDFDASDIVKLSNGYSFTMALMKSGEIWGWGIREQTLINGAVVPQMSPVKLDINVGEKIVDLEAGQETVLVLTESGRLFTWGEANFGNMGLGATYQYVTQPTEIPPFSSGKIVQIEVDVFTCAAVTDLGELFIWGQDEFNQDKIAYLKVPTLITSLSDIFVTKVSVGRSIAVLTNEGKVYTWGLNRVGELGIGDMDPRTEPQEVTALSEEVIVEIDCGTNHVLAVAQSGKVFAWGYNNRGQTGNVLTASLWDNFIKLPSEIASLSGKNVISVYAGFEYSMALTSTGEIYSWGFGSYGQLGTGNMDTMVSTPVLLDTFVK